MEIKSRFDHFNINVLDLDRSIAFYGKALGLKEHHRKEATDGSFTLVYLTDNETGFLLELTWLRDRKEVYELGDNESHLCFRVADLRTLAEQRGQRFFQLCNFAHGNSSNHFSDAAFSGQGGYAPQ